MKLVQIPFSAGSLGKNVGCELAPELVVKELGNIFLNEDGRNLPYQSELVAVDKNNIKTTNESIYKKIKSLNERSIIIGGDHSITYSCFKAFAEKNPGAGLIMFDAHPDCENSISPPTHEDFVQSLVNEKIIDKNKIILLGIRNPHGMENEFLYLNKINVFTMKKMFSLGLQDVCDTVTEFSRQWPAIYLSIDIDVVDPAFAPGTYYNEPAGLTSRELIYFLQRLRLLNNLKMADVVEINPKKDINNLTVKLGAKIVKELI